MERLTDIKYSTLIGAGMDLLPAGLLARLRYTHFFAGTDPIYAGVFSSWAEEFTEDYSPRSYRNVWCCAYAHQMAGVHPQTTVIVPGIDLDYPEWINPAMIVHELGHVLHEQLQFGHEATAVTEYGKTSHAEAFAEAFTVWNCPAYAGYYKQLAPIDEATRNLFERLAVN